MARSITTVGLLPGLVLILACASPARAAAPSDAIMSSSTRGFLSVADLKTLEARWNQTQMGQLVKDESMKPFIDDLKRQLERKMNGVRDSLGLTLEDLRDVAAGEIGIGLVEKETSKAAVAITIDVTGRTDAAQQLLAKVDAELIKRKAKKSAANSGGVVMTLYNIPPQNDKDIAREAAFFVHNDMLCAADSRLEAEEMIARLGGAAGDRLADVPPYQETMRRCAAEAGALVPELRWYADPWGYARAAGTLIRETEPQKRGKNYLKILEGQGFDAIQGVGGFVNLSAENAFEILHRTSIFAPPLPGEAEKYRLAMRMMEFPNSDDLQPQKWIPRKLASYRTFNCDLQNAYQHFGTLFDAIAGYEEAWTGVIEGLEDDPYGPQIEVGKDFIMQLGKRVTLVTDYEVPITTKSERFLVMIELANERAVQATVEKYMEADPNAHRREFEGKVVWEIMPPTDDVPELEIDVAPINAAQGQGAGGTAGIGAMSNSAVCVTDGHLFVASHLDFLQKVLGAKPANEVLANAGDYNEVEAAMNRLIAGPVAVRCFRRSDEAYRPTYELLRQGKMPEAETLLGRLLNRLLTPPEDEEEGILRKQKIDGRQLPPFEMVRRYFSPAGVVVRTVDDGWFVVGATLAKNPAEANAAGGDAVPATASRVR